MRDIIDEESRVAGTEQLVACESGLLRVQSVPVIGFNPLSILPTGLKFVLAAFTRHYLLPWNSSREGLLLEEGRKLQKLLKAALESSPACCQGSTVSLYICSMHF